MFETIKKAALEVMTGYQKDLEIDAQEIAAHPDVPFLHFTRATGTQIVMLLPVESYPAKGARVPFLFGTTDRHGMLQSVLTLSSYYKDPFHGPCLLAYYFDGHKVHKITVEKAAEIGAEYAAKIRRQFDQHEEKRGTA